MALGGVSVPIFFFFLKNKLVYSGFRNRLLRSVKLVLGFFFLYFLQTYFDSIHYIKKKKKVDNIDIPFNTH